MIFFLKYCFGKYALQTAIHTLVLFCRTSLSIFFLSILTPIQYLHIVGDRHKALKLYKYIYYISL